MERGKGIPKETEVDRRREVCEWEGCDCVKLYRVARGGGEKSFARRVEGEAAKAFIMTH